MGSRSRYATGASHYRLYDEQQMQRLRVVVLLREAGYNFPVIRSVLDEMAAGRPEKAIVAVEKRREELTWTSWRCIEALACFQRYAHEFCGELLARDSLRDGIQWGDFP